MEQEKYITKVTSNTQHTTGGFVIAWTSRPIFFFSLTYTGSLSRRLCLIFTSDAFLSAGGFTASWSLIKPGKRRDRKTLLGNQGWLDLPSFWDEEQGAEVVYEGDLEWEFAFVAPGEFISWFYARYRRYSEISL